MNAITIRKKVHFKRENRGRKRLRAGATANSSRGAAGRVPRISRLAALAIKLQSLVDEGTVRNFAELARLGYVSRARVSQVLNLTYLAPDLMEALLFLPPTEHGRDLIRERMIRPIAAERDWSKQRQLWRRRIVDSGLLEDQEPP